MRALLLVIAVSGCGAQTIGLTSATYSFDAVRGRELTPSATVTASTLELDVLTREVKFTIGGATRKFTLSQASTITPGCPGNFGSMPQDTRTLDAPNIQLAELLIDAPLVRADCPTGSGVIVLQTGPASSTGAAPDCSTEIICLAYKKK
ncbi:MAG: hypothetical protein Q8L14_29740 [Myxococcales bacterium]|nr:hypothetical protein [Myxococcales bacterium]